MLPYVGRPAYLLAALLVLWPPADFLVNVWPPHFDAVAWRYAAEGLLTGSLLITILGFLLASWLAMAQGHRRVLVGLGICDLILAVICIALAVDFLLNALQMRGQVVSQPGAMRTYDMGTLKGVGKLLITAAFLVWLPLIGRRWLRDHAPMLSQETPVIRAGS